MPQSHSDIECENCNKIIPITPSIDIIRNLPKYLIVILNRFSYDKNESKYNKLMTYIPLSLTLDLKKIFSYLPNKSTYKLYSIVVHKVSIIKKMEI